MFWIWTWLSTAVADGFPAAPSLAVNDWVVGSPVDIPAEGVVVVELWATWCGPCLEQLPHLNRLSEQYEHDISIVALSNESSRDVSRFWQRQSWSPSFTVAVDSSGRTTTQYMGIDGARGIPRSYIVHDGDVVWSGHPARMDTPLAAVVADNWSVQRAQFVAKLPEHYALYFQQAQAGDHEAAAETGEALFASAQQMPDTLNDLAWNILTEVTQQHRDHSLALRAARVAVAAMPDNPAYLDTLGLALFDSGEITEAIAVQRRALQACEDQQAAFCGELRERLTRFQASGG